RRRRVDRFGQLFVQLFLRDAAGNLVFTSAVISGFVAVNARHFQLLIIVGQVRSTHPSRRVVNSNCITRNLAGRYGFSFRSTAARGSYLLNNDWIYFTFYSLKALSTMKTKDLHPAAFFRLAKYGGFHVLSACTLDRIGP